MSRWVTRPCFIYSLHGACSGPTLHFRPALDVQIGVVYIQTRISYESITGTSAVQSSSRASSYLLNLVQNNLRRLHKNLTIVLLYESIMERNDDSR